jgi:hypothetical protein
MLKVVVADGIFIIGDLDDKNRLMNPRQVSYIKSFVKMPAGPDEERLLISMQPLPGWPAFIRINSNKQSYDVNPEDKSCIDLYRRLTTPKEPAPETEKGKIVILEPGLRKN